MTTYNQSEVPRGFIVSEAIGLLMIYTYRYRYTLHTYTQMDAAVESTFLNLCALTVSDLLVIKL